MSEPEKLVIKVNDADSVTALLYPASKKTRAGTTIILGHGAGANQLSGFMRLFAAGLAERGLDALTFNFIYTEKGRGAPDPKPKLEACWRAVIDVASKHKKLKGNDLFIHPLRIWSYKSFNLCSPSYVFTISEILRFRIILFRF